MVSPFHIMEESWKIYVKNWKRILIIPCIMFILSMIPSLAFPWSTVPNSIEPTDQQYRWFIVVQAISLIAYLLLTYMFMLEAWRIIKGTKKTFEQNALIAIQRFPFTLAGHIAVIALAVVGSAGYLLLYWLLAINAIQSGSTILSWPLILGLPLIIPSVYIVTRFMPVPLTVLLDNTQLANAFAESSKLTAHRWRDVCTRLFVPTILWSILNLVIILVLIIITFIILAIDPLNFSLSQSLSIISVQNMVETLFFLPLSTISILILYHELKK